MTKNVINDQDVFLQKKNKDLTEWPKKLSDNPLLNLAFWTISSLIVISVTKKWSVIPKEYGRAPKPLTGLHFCDFSDVYSLLYMFSPLPIHRGKGWRVSQRELSEIEKSSNYIFL